MVRIALIAAASGDHHRAQAGWVSGDRCASALPGDCDGAAGRRGRADRTHINNVTGDCTAGAPELGHKKQSNRWGIPCTACIHRSSPAVWTVSTCLAECY